MKEIKNTLPKTLVLKYSLAQGQCLNFLNMCTKPILSWFFGGIVSPKSSLVFTHRLAHQSYANKRVNHQATWSALSFCFWGFKLERWERVWLWAVFNFTFQLLHH